MYLFKGALHSMDIAPRFGRGYREFKSHRARFFISIVILIFIGESFIFITIIIDLSHFSTGHSVFSDTIFEDTEKKNTLYLAL